MHKAYIKVYAQTGNNLLLNSRTHIGHFQIEGELTVIIRVIGIIITDYNLYCEISFT